VNFVRCDGPGGCEKTFKPNMKERRDGLTGVLQYMRCEHCKKIYPIARITNEGVRLRARLQKLKGPKNESERERVLELYNAELAPLTDTWAQ
jgi:hypothetical protein